MVLRSDLAEPVEPLSNGVSSVEGSLGHHI